MKKLLLLLAVFTIMTACSSDDNNDCEQKVWGIGSYENNTYYLNVGKNSETAEPIFCDEFVANFYNGRLSAKERCYIGTDVSI